jgi:hypothetical protein
VQASALVVIPVGLATRQVHKHSFSLNRWSSCTLVPQKIANENVSRL